jgi:YkoY family integral membrane protein
MWGITAHEWLIIARNVLTLVFLEGLLSADNALVLAVMVRHLPKTLQKKALRYGIWGAFLFRFIAVVLATTILDYWQFEVVGGLYLLYLGVSHLVVGEHDLSPEAKVRAGRGFWGTVIGVELADIAFSIDSILAAVALADEMPMHLHDAYFGPFSVKDWTIYAGGVLGIIAMRFVAGFFLVLLDRFRGLAAGAYVLVGWIGVKLIGAGLHHALFHKQYQVVDGLRRLEEVPVPGGWRDSVPDWLARSLDMPGWLFWGGMILIVVASLLYKPKPASPSEGLVEVANEVLDEPGSDA